MVCVRSRATEAEEKNSKIKNISDQLARKENAVARFQIFDLFAYLLYFTRRLLADGAASASPVPGDGTKAGLPSGYWQVGL